MSKIDYGTVPTIKRDTKLRTIHTYVRLADRTSKFENFKWIDNKHLNNQYKYTNGQACVGQNKETGRWRVLFVCGRGF